MNHCDKGWVAEAAAFHCLDDLEDFAGIFRVGNERAHRTPGTSYNSGLGDVGSAGVLFNQVRIRRQQEAGGNRFIAGLINCVDICLLIRI